MAGNVYITGDKHGSFRTFFSLMEMQKFGKDDVLLITGDAGYIWDEDYRYKIETLEQLWPGTLAFIDGNHENHKLLNTFEVTNWCGGRVHKVGSRVYHLLRGEIFEICGYRYFTFGGARTVSGYVEGVEGIDWWLGEEPDEAEISAGRKVLYQNMDNIDYIITHEAPLMARECIERVKHIPEDYQLPQILGEWYAAVERAGHLKKWYFGHMHVDQVITPKLRAIHNNVLDIGTEEKIPIR